MGSNTSGILGALRLGDFALGETQRQRRQSQIQSLINRQSNRQQENARRRLDQIVRERTNTATRVEENRSTLFPERLR